MKNFSAGALFGGLGAAGLIGASVAPRPLPFIIGCQCADCRAREAIRFGHVMAKPGLFAQLQAAMHTQDTYVSQHGVFELIPNRFIQPIRPTKRAGRPYGYWQFKNGKLAPLYSSLDLPQTEDGMYTDDGAFYTAWDRGLGTFVCYAR